MLKREQIKLISIVVPAYKQEKTIQEDIKSLTSVLSTLPFKHEIIVVADGYVDDTYKNAKNNSLKNVKVLGYPDNRGKGYAVKFGMERATGDLMGFIDAGMDVNHAEIAVALNLLDLDSADIVVGSKLHPDSKVNYPLPRRILSWGYRFLTHLMFGFTVRDTQVGLKIFTKKAAKTIFPKLLVKKFAFDIEILAVAHLYGFKIVESPIKINFHQKSTITSANFWRVILRMLWDTMAVFYRLRILHYYDKRSR